MMKLVQYVATWVDILQGVVTLTAIVIGGWWAYSRFVRHREASPHASIEHATVFKSLTNDKTLARITVTLRNEGKVLLAWDDATVRIQKVLPCEPHIVTWLEERLTSSDEKRAEADWPLLAERTLTGLRNELEPGESDSAHVDFILKSDVKSVLVYSHVSNTTKSGIGWNHTSFHDIVA